MSGRLEFEFGFSTRGAPRREGQGPMRILVVGDFSGRASRGVEAPAGSLAERPLSAVDVDDFERLMFWLAPSIRLPANGTLRAATEIEFRELEDFHPDALFRRLAVFEGLRETRRRLLDPRTFEAAAAELRAAAPGVAPERVQSDAAPERAESDAATVERLLGQRPPEGGATRAQQGVESLIRDIVAPHVVPDAGPYQELYLRSVDEATGAQMRALLHHPEFQALEARWRGLHALVAGAETGEDLMLFVLDASKQELAADLAAAETDLAASGLYRLLAETGASTPDRQPWSLLATDYTFGPEEADVRALAALGAVAAQCGGPVLAAAAPSLLGCRSLAETPDPRDWPGLDADAMARWQALRRSPAARWIGLALPRVLLRVPYGSDSEPIEAFDFEELPTGERHDALLWGSPALACARLLAETFSERGWSMQPGDRLDLEDLPAHSYADAEGGYQMTPCAEVYLSERAGEAILSHGLMPLLSFRNRNAARVLRFQSIADPPAALSGAWS